MKRVLPLLLLAALLIAFRIVGTWFPETLPNFQPLSALFFCGALLATGWRAFAIPVAVWAVTFPFGVGHTEGPGLFLTTLASLAAVFILGQRLSRGSIPTILAGSIGAAVLFHLITGGAAWLVDPRYAKTLTGLWQSLWTGIPGDPLPSWVFLRNLAAANALFTGLVLLARLRLPKTLPAEAAPASA